MGSIDLNWEKFLGKGDDASFKAIYITYVDDLFACRRGKGYDYHRHGYKKRNSACQNGDEQTGCALW